jgi:hypothetical protein
MREIRPVRLIRKRDSPVKSEPSSSATPSGRPAPTEREVKTVVSNWVRDHRRRSEEFRRTCATLWQTGEFSLNAR